MKASLLIAVFSATLLLSGTSGIPSEVSQSEGCSEVRLDKSIMAHVSNHDQDGLSICTSYSAASALDAYRFRSGDKNYDFVTSAIANGIHRAFQKRDLNVSLGGGFCNAMDGFRKDGACDAAVFHPEGNKTAERNVQSLLNELRAHPDFFSRVDHVDEYLKENQKDCPDCAHNPDRLQNGIEVKLYAGDFFGRGNPAGTLDTVVTDMCLGKVKKPSVPQCTYHYMHRGRPAEAQDQINTALSMPNPLPVNVDICDRFIISGPSLQTIDWDKDVDSIFQNHTINPNKECGPHSVLVIGRRTHPKTQACQFLVRNSWGNQCSNKRYECNPETGDLWIDANVLSRNTFEISTLADKPTGLFN